MTSEKYNAVVVGVRADSKDTYYKPVSVTIPMGTTELDDGRRQFSLVGLCVGEVWYPVQPTRVNLGSIEYLADGMQTSCEPRMVVLRSGEVYVRKPLERGRREEIEKIARLAKILLSDRGQRI